MRKITFSPIPFNFWDITGVFFVGNHHEIQRWGDPYDYASLAALNDEAMAYAETMIPDDQLHGVPLVNVQYKMRMNAGHYNAQNYFLLCRKTPSLSNTELCPDDAYKAGYARGQA